MAVPIPTPPTAMSTAFAPVTAGRPLSRRRPAALLVVMLLLSLEVHHVRAVVASANTVAHALARHPEETVVVKAGCTADECDGLHPDLTYDNFVQIMDKTTTKLPFVLEISVMLIGFLVVVGHFVVAGRHKAVLREIAQVRKELTKAKQGQVREARKKMCEIMLKGPLPLNRQLVDLALRAKTKSVEMVERNLGFDAAQTSELPLFKRIAAVNMARKAPRLTPDEHDLRSFVSYLCAVEQDVAYSCTAKERSGLNAGEEEERENMCEKYGVDQAGRQELSYYETENFKEKVQLALIKSMDAEQNSSIKEHGIDFGIRATEAMLFTQNFASLTKEHGIEGAMEMINAASVDAMGVVGLGINLVLIIYESVKLARAITLLHRTQTVLKQLRKDYVPMELRFHQLDLDYQICSAVGVYYTKHGPATADLIERMLIKVHEDTIKLCRCRAVADSTFDALHCTESVAYIDNETSAELGSGLKGSEKRGHADSCAHALENAAALKEHSLMLKELENTRKKLADQSEEIQQGACKDFFSSDPADFEGENAPIESVMGSYRDPEQLVSKKSRKKKKARNTYTDYEAVHKENIEEHCKKTFQGVKAKDYPSLTTGDSKYCFRGEMALRKKGYTMIPFDWNKGPSTHNSRFMCSAIAPKTKTERQGVFLWTKRLAKPDWYKLARKPEVINTLLLAQCESKGRKYASRGPGSKLLRKLFSKKIARANYWTPNSCESNDVTSELAKIVRDADFDYVRVEKESLPLVKTVLSLKTLYPVSGFDRLNMKMCTGEKFSYLFARKEAVGAPIVSIGWHEGTPTFDDEERLYLIPDLNQSRAAYGSKQKETHMWVKKNYKLYFPMAKRLDSDSNEDETPMSVSSSSSPLFHGSE